MKGTVVLGANVGQIFKEEGAVETVKIGKGSGLLKGLFSLSVLPEFVRTRVKQGWASPAKRGL